MSRNENPGIFPQKTQQILIIGHRDLLEADEIIMIVKIVIQECHAQWQDQGDGQQEQRMFSESLHSAVFPIRREIKPFSASAVNGRFDSRFLWNHNRKHKRGKRDFMCPKPSITG
jgi:hypothetical protein